MEAEKASLDERRREAALERASAREETGRLHQELQDTDVERRALEASESQLQEARVSLEAQLSLLLKEKTQAQELHAQV